MAQSAQVARLLKLVGMTGSSADGEALTALRMSQKLMRELGICWGDIFEGKLCLGDSSIRLKPFHHTATYGAYPYPSAPPRPPPRPSGPTGKTTISPSGAVFTVEDIRLIFEPLHVHPLRPADRLLLNRLWFLFLKEGFLSSLDFAQLVELQRQYYARG